MVEFEKQKQYQYVQKIDFYPKATILQIAISNSTIYMYSTLDEISIIQLFALNGQQKYTKKFQLELREIHFMNQKREFVIQDWNSISIWRLEQKYNWAKLKTILNDRNDEINSLVIGENDDLIINSMRSGALYFWRKNIDWKCFLQLKENWGNLKHLSINQKGNILIATNGKEIFLFSYNDDKQIEWALTNKIKKEQYALCFIDNASFACISNG